MSIKYIDDSNVIRTGIATLSDQELKKFHAEIDWILTVIAEIEKPRASSKPRPSIHHPAMSLALDAKAKRK